jgi:dTDP-4-amino-4,6-dideoxygalactose transaminase
MSRRRVFLSPPDVGPNERALLLDAFDSNWIAPLGPHVDAFEREVAAYAGVDHAAALSSGTAGLHLALQILGVGPGDEVLTSTLTFAATANAIRYVGASPVFIDSEAATWNMDPALLEEELTRLAAAGRLPKAVLVVDLYGQCADYAPIAEVCARFSVPIVEDAAEALGATYAGKPAGSFGVMGVFSFNGNKIITTSGGGMLVSNNATWIARARHLATQARDPAPHYEHTDIGFNYRLSNLLAAVGRGQLESLPVKIGKRRRNNELYREALGELPGFSFMPESTKGVSNCWLTCITVDPARAGVDREVIRKHLESLDIEARPVWKPMHLQPVFSACRAVGGEVSAQLFRDGLCLPSGSSLTDEDRARVIDGVLGVPGLRTAGAFAATAPQAGGVTP